LVIRRAWTRDAP